MTDKTTTGSDAVDLDKLAAIADRVEARGLFNAACDIRDWIQEVHAAQARAAAPVQPNEFAWPEPPASKGQSHVLFEDGYDEGWAKAIDTVRAMFSARAAAPAANAQTANLRKALELARTELIRCIAYPHVVEQVDAALSQQPVQAAGDVFNPCTSSGVEFKNFENLNINDAAPAPQQAAPLTDAPAEIPQGCAIDGRGTTYHNVAEIYYQAEACEALHMWLDDKGAPRADSEGRVLSPVGRVAGFVRDAERLRWLIENHDDADVREKARDLATRLGVRSYYAITRDIDAAMSATPERELSTGSAASAGDARQLYTCIDKGGEYELLGEAYGAGTMKGSAVTVYRDTTTEDMFYRSIADFGKRMRPIDRAAMAATKEKKQ